MSTTKPVLIIDGMPVGEIGNNIKTKTFTGTTSNSGSISLDLSYPDCIVLSVIEPSSGHSALPKVYNTYWYAEVYNSPTSGSITPVRETSVSLTVIYIE